jgi:RNA polymerase sigma-70 factor (ECF subfamily)
MEEQKAIARLKKGDIGGLEVLVTRYQVQAVRAAYLITRDRALAEDVVQAAFLRVYERIGQFDARRPFAPWFLRSVVNDAVKMAVRREREVQLEDDESGSGEGWPDPAPDPLSLIAAAETREAVWAALSGLPPAQRAAIVLRYYLDLGESDMAEHLAAPTGTVKWRLHAARQRLRVLLWPLALAGTAAGQVLSEEDGGLPAPDRVEVK